MASMAEVHPFPDIDKVKDEASAWIVRLQADDATQDDRAAFDRWREAHPSHARIYEEISATWRQFATAGELVRAVAFAQSIGAAGETRHRKWIWLSAASVAVVAIMATLFYGTWMAPTRAFRTAIGEQASVALLDGSSMQLNSDSAVRVEFSPGARVIRLEQGEAFFKVAHDARRPFWVVHGNSWVRAVGTAFNIYVRASDVQVTVTEGAVKVGVAKSSGMPSDRELETTAISLLAAGQQADIGAAATLTRRLSAAQLTVSGAWRTGSVYFEGEPLSHVVEQMNRYTNDQLVLVDDGLRELAVGGTFHANPEGAEALLATLEQGFGLHVRREGARIYIERRE